MTKGPEYHPPKTCFCCSSRCIVLFAAAMSVLVSLAFILPCVLLMVDLEAWLKVKEALQAWCEHNHWDAQVSMAVWRGFLLVDQHHQWILAGIISAASLHLLLSLLVILGVMLSKRTLFVPWMISKMVLIILMVIVFVGWSFLSFFVDLIVAMVFPFLGGLVLGMWICLWKEVLGLWQTLGSPVFVRTQLHKSGYKPVPVARDRQLTTISEADSLTSP